MNETAPRVVLAIGVLLIAWGAYWWWGGWKGWISSRTRWHGWVAYLILASGISTVLYVLGWALGAGGGPSFWSRAMITAGV
ncbi:MAG: hypothetical protein Q4G64_09120, partial [bacterium]|nr:hypothetical protein [bacterium]